MEQRLHEHSASRATVVQCPRAGDTDAEWVCDVLTGPLISAAFLTGVRTLSDDLAAATVALVLSRYKRVQVATL